MPFEYVLYDMSYANLMLYGAAMPSYSSKKKDDKAVSSDKCFQADDPRNKQRLENFFKSIKE